MNINFWAYIASSGVGINIFSRSVHHKPNHYDVLKLNQNCSSQDIKKAYIELSKKYHPDRNTNVNPKLFHDVSNAYKILSKPNLRQEYDRFILPEAHRTDHYEDFIHKNPMNDPTFFRNRDRSYDHFYEQKPYYGIKGVQRVSNGIILYCCLLLMIVGATIQFVAIRYSFTFRRDELLKKSAEASKNLNQSRQAAEENGNKKQIENLEEKFRMNDMNLK